jgi:phage shock protein E
MAFNIFGAKKQMKNFLIFSLVLFITSCLAQDFPSVSAEQAYKMKSDSDSVVFVDVRTVDEFTGPLGHVEDAILIPLDKLEDEIHTLDQYKDQNIIVYCRSGNRSQSGTRILRENGFKAINMLGGIKAWNSLKDKK